MDEVKPAARLPTVEHREPCESRGSRTVLGASGGEIPPGDSSEASVRCIAAIRPESGVKPTCQDSSTDATDRMYGPAVRSKKISTSWR